MIARGRASLASMSSRRMRCSGVGHSHVPRSLIRPRNRAANARPERAAHSIGRPMGPRIMGILNVTPDSFSDGGEWFEYDQAVRHGRALVAAGAQLSVDTMKLTVAEAAVDAGATYVNDVTAFRHEPEMAAFVAERGCDCCLMHMLGEPRTMQRDPRYEDVVDDVRAFLEERAEFAVREGVREERIMVDPGIGFGKTLEHNLELLRRLDEIVALGFDVVIGTSRKSFLGRLTDREDPHDRVAATVATTVLAYERGASVFRVHDVAPTRDALAVATATLRRDGA